METYYYLYRITNLINGKIYVGVHKTDNIDDGYMGSGLLIRRAIEKYGIENFEKNIIQYFNSAEEMFEAESQIVNEEFVADDSTYNLKEGGHGGWDYITKNHIYPNRDIGGRIGGRIAGQIHAERMRNDIEYRKQVFDRTLRSVKPFKGQHHTPETKARIGAANSKNQLGSKNSNYGKMWIYNTYLKQSKCIPKGDPIPEGWKRGRKMKF